MASSLAALKITKPKMNLGKKFLGQIIRIKSGKPFSILVRPSQWCKTFASMEKFLHEKYFVKREGEYLDSDDARGVSGTMCVLQGKYGATRGEFTGDWAHFQDEEEFSVLLVDEGSVIDDVYLEDRNVFELDEAKVLDEIPPLYLECHLIGLEELTDNYFKLLQMDEMLVEKVCEVKVVGEITNREAYVKIKMRETGEDLNDIFSTNGFGYPKSDS